MSAKFEERADLQMAYSDKCEKVREAKQAQEKAEQAIYQFDAEYPEVMRDAAKELGDKKRAERGASGITHDAAGDAAIPSAEGEGG